MKHKAGREHASGRARKLRRAGFLRLMGAGVMGGSALAAERGTAQAATEPPTDLGAKAGPGSAGKASGAFSIGILTDCQYADADTPANMPQRLYRRSPQKLADAIAALTEKPDDLEFLLHMGDVIDRDGNSFRVVMPLLKAAPVPVFQVAGNHDYSVADPLKAKVPELLGMPAPYYVKERGLWRFIFLDGNELSLFSSPAGSPPYLAAEEFRKASKRKLEDYSGGLGEKQRAWLRDQLAAARADRRKVAIVCHYPLLPVDVHTLWDNGPVEALVEEFRDVVAVWFNGHNHAGNYCAKHGIHFVNLRGMLDTETNAYARADFYPDRIEITGHGREPSRTLKFPAPDAEPEKPPVLKY
ncbi:MAG: phosphatase [Verrucomicrobiales bacterium]|nr:phosphatase [Verrucomicrobiales bacterium]